MGEERILRERRKSKQENGVEKSWLHVERRRACKKNLLLGRMKEHKQVSGH